MSRPDASLETTAVTLGYGAAGGILFWAIGLPLAFLSGAMAGVAAAALAMRPVGLPVRLREAAIILLGVTLGSTVTPDTLALLPRWPVTLAVLVVTMLAIMASGAFYLERVHGLDRPTARLSAMPGALNFVMALALETTSDQRRVAIIQVVRISAILLLLPSLVSLAGGQIAAQMPQPAGSVVKPLQLIVVVGVGIAFSMIFARMGTPAPQLFGSMIGSAALFGPGILDTAIPEPLIAALYLVLGSLIGSNFVGTDMRLFLVTAGAGLGSLAVSSLVALAFAVPAAWAIGVPTLQVWLAYAPGGVETTALLALALGLDAAFVSSHHIMRVIVLNVLVPFWVAPYMKKDDDQS